MLENAVPIGVRNTVVLSRKIKGGRYEVDVCEGSMNMFPNAAFREYLTSDPPGALK